MHKVKISLRKKISIPAFIIISVVGFLVSWGIYSYLGNLLVNNKIIEVQKVSSQKAKEIGYILEKNELFIEMLGTRTRVREFLEDQSEERRNELQGIFDEYAKTNKDYLSIYLMNADGETLVSTDRTFIGKNYAFRNYFQKTKETKAPFMEALLGKTSNQFGYYFSYPVINSENEVIGVAVVKVDEKEMAIPLVENLSLGVDDIFLVDENGIVLAAKSKEKVMKSLGELSEEEKRQIKESEKFLDKEIESLDYQLAQDWVKNHNSASPANESVKIYDDFDKKEEILGINKILKSPFFMIKELDLDAIRGEVLPIVYIISLGVFIAAVLVAIFIYILVGYLLRDLDKIREFYEKVGQGDFTKKIEVKGNDELGDLARAFNLMEDNLKKYYKKLEKDVVDKAKIVEESKNELQSRQTALVNVLDDVEWERKNTQKEKDKIDAILHSIGDGVFVVDADKKIIMINNITEKISGFNEKELVGKKYNDNMKFIFEKDEKENTLFIDQAIETGKSQEMANHTMLVRKDGTRVPVADSAAPLKNSKGEIVGCVVVFRDVTKEREVDRMKTEFVSLASHQLRTPLTSIKWYAELLLTDEEKGKLKGEKREFVEEIHGGNERMINLVNDLLNVSRIETGKKFVIEKIKTDIGSLVTQAVKEQEVIAGQKNIQIVCENELKKKALILIDGEKIRQVFQNFISNAVKYSPAKSTIIVNCHENEENYIFSVKDQGLGIPKDQQARIFEKFFRASNVILTEAEGTGLGLYIAKSIVEGHGGKIWFESVDKKGTTFYFSLPKKV